MRYRRVHIPGATNFFTIVTHQRRPLFRDLHCVELYTNAVELVRARHPFDVEAYIILPDHIHAIWRLPAGDSNYSSRWRLIKEAFTRSFLKDGALPARSATARSRGEQPVWQRRFWEHAIRDERDFAVHLDYIHYNPVKHGLASAARDWPHSSFSSWVERGVYEVEWGTDEAPKFSEWPGNSE